MGFDSVLKTGPDYQVRVDPMGHVSAVHIPSNNPLTMSGSPVKVIQSTAELEIAKQTLELFTFEVSSSRLIMYSENDDNNIRRIALNGPFTTTIAVYLNSTEHCKLLLEALKKNTHLRTLTVDFDSNDHPTFASDLMKVITRYTCIASLTLGSKAYANLRAGLFANPHLVGISHADISKKRVYKASERNATRKEKLFRSCAQGNVEAARKLLEKHRFFANAKDEDAEDTPLHEAVRANQTEIVKLLIEHQAELWTNSANMSPYQISVRQGTDEITALLAKSCLQGKQDELEISFNQQDGQQPIDYLQPIPAQKKNADGQAFWGKIKAEDPCPFNVQKPVDDPYQNSSLLNSNFFGPSDWKKLGVKVDATPVPDKLLDVWKAADPDSHLYAKSFLFYLPKEILTLSTFNNLAKNAKKHPCEIKFTTEDFILNPQRADQPISSRWIMMLNDLLPDSRGIRAEAIKARLAEMNQGNSDPDLAYCLLTTEEVLIGIMLKHLHDGTKLFPNFGFTNVITDECLENPNSYAVVGSFDGNKVLCGTRSEKNPDYIHDGLAPGIRYYTST